MGIVKNPRMQIISQHDSHKCPLWRALVFKRLWIKVHWIQVKRCEGVRRMKSVIVWVLIWSFATISVINDGTISAFTITAGGTGYKTSDELYYPLGCEACDTGTYSSGYGNGGCSDCDANADDCAAAIFSTSGGVCQIGYGGDATDVDVLNVLVHTKLQKVIMLAFHVHLILIVLQPQLKVHVTLVLQAVKFLMQIKTVS